MSGGSRRRFVRVIAVVAAATALVPAATDAATVDPGDCAWPLKADPDLVNIAWPDEGAQYWAAPFTTAPGGSVAVQGRFPHARYMSFHLYEGSTPIDALADVEIAADSGVNPFVESARRNRPGTYTVRVVDGPKPTRPEPNTLYAGSLNGEPNVAGVILYRVYLPERDKRGGVGLPRVAYGAGDGGPDLAAPLAPCQDPVPTPPVSLNEQIREGSLPYDTPHSSSPAPTWGTTGSQPSTTTAGPVGVRTGNPFFANFHNTYLSLLVSREAGDLVAFRAKAPTFPDTTGAKVMGGGQLRYWSICSNDFPTTRYVACLADEQAVIDSDGYFTVVVSDPAHRPRDLTRADNWLAAGTYPDIFLLYRQMLPAPDFAEAVARAPDPAKAAETMGAYYPDTKVCSTPQFERDRCGLPATTPARRAKAP